MTGTLYQVDGYQSSAIQVPYPMTNLRFWRNTPNVAKTASGGSWTLTQNILGYEWDVAPDNGFSPPGLIKLSSRHKIFRLHLCEITEQSTSPEPPPTI